MWAYAGSPTLGAAGVTDAYSLTKPTGTADGDLLVALAYTDVTTMTGPAGWIKVAEVTNPGNQTLTAFIKIASSEPASWTFTNASPVWTRMACARYTGAIGTDSNRVDGTPGTTFADGANMPAQSAPSITTLVNGSLVIFVYCNYSGNDPSATSGFATNFRFSHVGLTLADAVQATAGATGSTVISAGSVGTEDYNAMQFAVLESAGGGGGSTKVPWRLNLMGVS